MKTLSDSATCYDNQGYQTQSGITVIDHGGTIQIGATLHNKDDLTFADQEIESNMAKWRIVL